MDFGQTELERALHEPLERFLSDRYDFQTRKKRLAGGAWQPDMWHSFASELGVLGAALPESAGGLGGGPAEIGAIMQAFGRHLVVEPFLSTIVMGASFVRTWDSTEASRLLAEIGAGDTTIAVAHAEPEAGYDPAQVKTRAVAGGAGFVLNGHKTLVLNAAHARHLIVVARTAGTDSDRSGISIFILDAAAEGLERTDYRTIDGGSASDIVLNNVIVPKGALIGLLGEGLPIVERVLDEATAAVCAEGCGVMQTLLNLTVDYTRQRKQFGRAIAEFQVLQHRMVDMMIAMKQSVMLAMMSRIKLDTPDRAAAVSAAKSRIGRACRMVSQSAVQLHGGIGIADETPVSHYFRRAMMIEKQFGSSDYHLGRYERLQIEGGRA
jgi:hypothetical protein